MIKVHLVGFTIDLRSLVFSRRRGAEAGNYLLEIDERLRRTLEEVAKLEDDVRSGRAPPLNGEESPAEGEPRQRRPSRASRLSPRQIQSLLRAGKSPEEVARLAEADVSWVERFTGPILAERAEIVAAVKEGRISKPRLGLSGAGVGDAIRRNLQDRRINIPPDILDEGWSAIRRDDGWEVTFRYLSRGRAKLATFSLNPGTKEVVAVNALAADLGWRPAGVGSRVASQGGAPRRKRRTRAVAAATKSSKAKEPSPPKSSRLKEAPPVKSPGPAAAAPAGSGARRPKSPNSQKAPASTPVRRARRKRAGSKPKPIGG